MCHKSRFGIQRGGNRNASAFVFSEVDTIQISGDLTVQRHIRPFRHERIALALTDIHVVEHVPYTAPPVPLPPWGPIARPQPERDLRTDAPLARIERPHSAEEIERAGVLVSMTGVASGPTLKSTPDGEHAATFSLTVADALVDESGNRLPLRLSVEAEGAVADAIASVHPGVPVTVTAWAAICYRERPARMGIKASVVLLATEVRILDADQDEPEPTAQEPARRPRQAAKELVPA